MMFETNMLIDCMFDVACTIFFNRNRIMCCALEVTNEVVIMIDVMHFANSHLDYFVDVYVLGIDKAAETNYIDLQSIFARIITLFNGVRKYFIHSCIVSIQHCCGSCYKFFICFIDSPMTLLSFNQLALVIYGKTEVIEANCKYQNDVFAPNKFRSPIERCIESDECMGCTKMNYDVILIHLCTDFMCLYVLCKRTNVIKTIWINLQSVFEAITIFGRLLEIFVILMELFSNYIVLLQNIDGFQSYCTFIC